MTEPAPADGVGSAGFGSGGSAGDVSDPAGDNVVGDAPSAADAGSDESVVEAEPTAAVAVFAERVELARRYVQALATDGVVRGLIGPREPARLWTRHVLNSAAVASLIADGSTVVDIGSGAGLPGIPLAIARPDLFVTLVEPLERRVRFLVEVVEDLGLTNCTVVRGRAEEVVKQCGDADVVTSRAVAPLNKLAKWSAPLARDGGVVLALKGASAAEELERDRRAVTAAGLVDAEVIRLGGTGAVAAADGAVPDDVTFVIRARRRATGRAAKSAKRRR